MHFMNINTTRTTQPDDKLEGTGALEQLNLNQMMADLRAAGLIWETTPELRAAATKFLLNFQQSRDGVVANENRVPRISGS